MQAQHLQTGLRPKYKNRQNLVKILKKISSHIFIIEVYSCTKGKRIPPIKFGVLFWNNRYGVFQALFGFLLQFSSGSPIG